jgi:hypothetical protein
MLLRILKPKNRDSGVIVVVAGKDDKLAGVFGGGGWICGLLMLAEVRESVLGKNEENWYPVSCECPSECRCVSLLDHLRQPTFLP